VKRVLVVGATSGIGRALSERLAEKGVELFLIGRNKALLSELVCKLNGDKHDYFCADLSFENSLDKFVIDRSFDGVAYCAGQESLLPLRAISYKRFSSIMNLHVFNFLNIIKSISKFKGRGDKDPCSIVGMSSYAARNGGKTQTLYSSSKAAMEAVVRPLSIELLEQNIRINTISPGLVNTEMTRRWAESIKLSEGELTSRQWMGMADVNDVVNLIYFLLSDNSKHIAGTNVDINGIGPVTLLD